MTDTQKALITLVKSAIFEAAYELPEAFSVSDALSLAHKHGIVVLAYYGAVNCGVDSSCEVMRDAFARVCRELLVGERQMADIKCLVNKFCEIGAHNMPLKGARLKGNYPKQEMRRMSDADILIKDEQYDRIRELMLSLGYTEGEVSYQDYSWQKGSTHIELHKCLVSPYVEDFYAYFGDGWKLAKPIEGSDFEYAMTLEDEMLYLFAHFAKHYRGSGIGVRHMVDLWVYRNAHPNLDETYINTELKKLRLDEFYANILRTLDTWFGACEGDEITEFITQFIFSSGEFGKEATWTLSVGVKEKKKGKNAFFIFVGKVLFSLFMPYKAMCLEYPILRKAPVLLPVMWIVHFVSRITTKGKVKKYLDTHAHLKDEQIDAYQKSLNLVGLDFNFPEE